MQLLKLPRLNVLQLGLVVLLCIAVLGHKIGLLGFKLAFLGFAGLTLVVFIAGLVGLVMAFIGKTTYRAGCGALVVGVAPIALVLAMIGPGLKVPGIHDISTDLEAPPEFTAAQALRQQGENSLSVASKDVKALQASFYTDLAPLSVGQTPDKAYKTALATAEQLGWHVHFTDSAKLRFEAVDETALFGFKDDIAVRVRATATGSVIDLRSVSRVGESDLGANANRIRRFISVYPAQ